MYVERREIELSDLISGGLASGNLGPGSVISGVIASGAIGTSNLFSSGVVLSNWLLKSSFPTTTAITGNFSWSGVSAGTSGVAIASGSYTPTSTGKLLITANAYVQGTVGGLAGNSVIVALVSGTIVGFSGVTTPASYTESIFGITSGAISDETIQFPPVLLSGLPIGTSGNYAIIMGLRPLE